MGQTYQCRISGEGGRIDHTPGADVGAGDVVVINGMFAFAPQPIASGVLGTLRAAGGPPLVTVVKANGAISVGNDVYWDADGNPQGGTAGTGAATTTSTGNTFIGRCAKAAGATDEVVEVQPSIGVVTQGGLQNAITDPADAGAIPVTRSGHVPLVTGGAETRTIAAPDSVGLELLLYLKTKVGNCVVTCATTLNETGNNTITFSATGQAVRLVSVEEDANKRWRLASVDGAALSTV